MNIISAQYLQDRVYDPDTDTSSLDGINRAIIVTIDGATMTVPLSEGNSDYQEIMRQVEEGTLTIAEAD